MKNLNKLFLLFIAAFITTISFAQSYSGGDGTSGNPYQIANLTDLQYLSEHSADWGGGFYFKQTADIDASATSTWNSGAGFNPIGNHSDNFGGSYDGNSYTISGLVINRGTSDYIAFFGYLFRGSIIRNVVLIGGSVTGRDYTGFLVGWSLEGTISNSSATGAVSGNSAVGGLVAYIGEASISNCYATGAVSGTSSVGGLVGQADGGLITISDCYATGAVTGNAIVGGLVGYGYADILNCYATGAVSGGSAIGGLVGVGGATNSYYLSNPDNGIGTQKTSTELQTQSTYTGWDFINIWSMGDCNVDLNYPKLRWQIFSGGAGTTTDPFLIANLDDLRKLSENPCLWDKHFKQTADIDASATNTWNVGDHDANSGTPDEAMGFSPIGKGPYDVEGYFTGSYDGNYFEISNLYSNRPAQDMISLFGYISGEIKNIFVKNGTFIGNYAVGGLVAFNSGTIRNSASSANVTGDYDIGGLAGRNNLLVTNCYATGTVTGNTNVGGLIGQMYFSTLTNSYSTGLATGTTAVGGLVGYIYPGTISNSFYNSDVVTTNNGLGTPKNTVDMKDQSTFTTAGWDFSSTPIWKMGECTNNGYPVFQWQTTVARPTISSPLSDARCGIGTVSLGATASAGAVKWYADEMGGSSLHTGTSYTPSITSTTSYWVEADNGGCLSATRTEVIGTINDCSTKLNNASCGTTLGNTNGAIYCKKVNGATKYRYIIQHTPTGYYRTVTVETADTMYKFSWIGLPENSGYTYSVRVSAFVDDSWQPYGETCLVTVLNTEPKLDVSSCGVSLTNLNTPLYCTSVPGATDYRYIIRNVATGYYRTFTKGSGDNSLLLNFNDIAYNRSYTISVSAFVSGKWSTYGNSCIVTTPAKEPKLEAPWCNSTLPSASTQFSFEQIPEAVEYRLIIRHPGTGYYRTIYNGTTNGRYYRLSWIGIPDNGLTYLIRISYKTANNIWSPYGTECSLTTPGSGMKQADEDLQSFNLETYPNPNDGHFTISSSHEGNFNIINEVDQLIQKVEIKKENNYQTKVENLRQGVYFVTGTINNEVITKKVVVQ